MCDKAIKDKYISTFFGNRRLIRDTDIENFSANRWIPNQLIQGTASYILKKSILELNKLDFDIDFLIPMHDAILIEVKDDELDEVKLKVKEIFEMEFKKVCPQINTSISFELFHN